MAEEENTTRKPTQYEKQAKYIKAYLANRYETDAGYKEKINKQRAINMKIQYNTDPEYRERIKLQRKEQCENLKIKYNTDPEYRAKILARYHERKNRYKE
jgi:hypothetical protein